LTLPRGVFVVISHIKAQTRRDLQIFADVSRSNELAEVLECAGIFLKVSEIRGASQGLELGGQMRVVLQDAAGLVLAMALDEPCPPPAEALFPRVLEAPMLPRPGYGWRPCCPYVE